MKAFRSLLLAVLAMIVLGSSAALAQNTRQTTTYIDDGTGLFTAIKSATLSSGGQTVTFGNGGAASTNYALIVGTSGWTAGDIYYASSTPGLLTRLAKGSDNQILTMSSVTHLPIWSSTVSATTNFANITLTDASNQIQLGNLTNHITLTGPTPGQPSTYSIPDVGASANFVMTAGNQAIAGNKSFTTKLGIGSGTTSPTSALELNGDFSIDRHDTSGIADNAGITLASAGYSNIRVTGPTTSDTLVGISGGVAGKRLRIYQPGTATLFLKNNASTASASNQIVTLAGGDVSYAPNSSDGTAVELVYDGVLNKWVLQNSLTKSTTGIVAGGLAYCIVGSTKDTASNTGLHTSHFLTFNATAGATYEVRGLLIVSNNSDAQNTLALGFSDSGGTNVTQVSTLGYQPASGNTNINGAATILGGGFSNLAAPGKIGASVANNAITISGIIKASATGTISLLYRYTSSATLASTYIAANSYLAVTRVN